MEVKKPLAARAKKREKLEEGRDRRETYRRSGRHGFNESGSQSQQERETSKQASGWLSLAGSRNRNLEEAGLTLQYVKSSTVGFD